MKVKSPFLVKPGTRVKLSSWKTGVHPGVPDSEAAEALLDEHRKQLSDEQELLYASQARAVLIVLQGMDTAGKDGTIRHIFTGFNPQGCDVAAFKVPTALEARHDFLWRCHKEVPPRGMIGIFNRSHYEDVLSPRVHGQLSRKEVRARLEDINAWESTLANNDVILLKFFLHISRKEQTERLQARIDDPSKHWKLSLSDFKERQFWDDYMEAYQDIFEATSRKHAPWYIIPSDHKWFRNVAISRILYETMKDLKLDFPAPTFDPSGIDLHADSPEDVARKADKRLNPDAPAATEQHNR
jgi:PPK2 family polyphosphate:nucleotide phosphotransferase